MRSRRDRVSAPVYNLVQLSGTAGHGKRRAKGDIVADRRRRRTVSGPVSADDNGTSPGAAQGTTPETVRSGIDALGVTQSASKLDSPRTRRQILAEDIVPNKRPSTRRSSAIAPVAATPTNKKSKITKRSRKSVDKAETPMSRELRRLQDTKEFAHIDEKPVIQSVWSNGKFVDPKAPAPPSRKKAEPEPTTEEPKEAEPEPVVNTRKRRVKKYLDKGLYAGQDAPIDISKGLTVGEKKTLAQLPELIPSGRVNKTMPLPMFNGLRTLIEGRDFKLPYQVCHPLPPGQPKPDEWKKMTKSKFWAKDVTYKVAANMI
jgi:histone-lysine N-methyltransferase ASH1L